MKYKRKGVIHTSTQVQELTELGAAYKTLQSVKRNIQAAHLVNVGSPEDQRLPTEKLVEKVIRGLEIRYVRQLHRVKKQYLRRAAKKHM